MVYGIDVNCCRRQTGFGTWCFDFVSALVSINDSKNERILKVNVTEQASQSIPIPKPRTSSCPCLSKTLCGNWMEWRNDRKIANGANIGTNNFRQCHFPLNWDSSVSKFIIIELSSNWAVTIYLAPHRI